MGKFTSDYTRTTVDSNGVRRTQEYKGQIDPAAIGGSAVGPLLILAMVAFVVIAALPALVFLPLIVYLYYPYNTLKRIFKNHDDIKEYENEVLKEQGFKNLGHLNSNTKIKFFLFSLLILSVIVYIDYSVFSAYSSKYHNLMDKVVMVSLSKSALFGMIIYPLFGVLMHKNRIALQSIDDKKKLATKTLSVILFPITFLKKRSNRSFQILKTLFLAFIFYLTILIVVENYNNYAIEKYETIVEGFSYNQTRKEYLSEAQAYMEDNELGINDSIGGVYGIYSITKFLEPFDPSRNMRYLRRISQGSTVLEEVSKTLGMMKRNDSYKQTYPFCLNLLKIYTKNGGDLQVRNAVSDIPAIAKVENIAFFAAMKKLGASTEGYDKQIFKNMLHSLQFKDEGFSKKFAKIVRESDLTKEEAIAFYNEEKRWMEYYNQISLLKEIKKIAGIK